MDVYNVKGARLFLETAEEDTKIVKGEFRPKFGFNTRYTVYDLDENEMIQTLEEEFPFDANFYF